MAIPLPYATAHLWWDTGKGREEGSVRIVGCRMVRCNCYFPDCFGSPVSIKRVFHGSSMLVYILRAGILILGEILLNDPELAELVVC